MSKTLKDIRPCADDKGVERVVLSEVYRALSQSVDFSSGLQRENLARNLSTLQCLSLQDAFSRQGSQTQGNIIGKMTRTILHLRFILLTYAFAFTRSMKSPGGKVIENDFTKPGPPSVSGMVYYTAKGLTSWNRNPSVPVRDDQMVHRYHELLYGRITRDGKHFGRTL